MKEIVATNSGRSYTIVINMGVESTNVVHAPTLVFVCDVADEQNRPILEYSIPASHAPYFFKSYKSSIPNFLKNAAKMFINFHEQKLPWA